MNQLKPLYIIGAGGFGRETAWLVERINAVSGIWDLRGFIDDDASLWGTERDGYMALGGLSVLKQSSETAGRAVGGNSLTGFVLAAAAGKWCSMP